MSKILPAMMPRSVSMSKMAARTVLRDPKRRVENQMNPTAEIVYDELRRVASSRAEVLNPVFAMPWLWWRGLRGDRMIAPGGTSPLGMLGHVNAALEVCREACQILGANGITLEYPVIRHMNNLESVVTYEGTAEVHSLVLGQAITGHAAYR